LIIRHTHDQWLMKIWRAAAGYNPRLRSKKT
jgi:hypothetical protein